MTQGSYQSSGLGSFLINMRKKTVGLVGLAALVGTLSGCGTLSKLGDGIAHNISIYTGVDGKEHTVKLKDGTYHTLEICGEYHDQPQDKVDLALSKLTPQAARLVKRFIRWKKEDYHFEAEGDAHYFFNHQTICVSGEWKLQEFVHEIGHLFYRSLSSEQQRTFDAVGAERYGKDLAPAAFYDLSNSFSKNHPLNPGDGPANGFVCAYAANTQSECFARTFDVLFALAYRQECIENGGLYEDKNPFDIVAESIGTPQEHHHYIEDHIQRIQLMAQFGALTNEMSSSFFTKVYSKRSLALKKQ